MSAATLINTCQVCGAEESLDGLILRMIDDDQVRRLIAAVLTTSLPLGGQLVRYLRLHKPPKQRLRMDKLAKLLGELVPDIQRTAIERNGRMWVVGPDAWKAALQAVFEAHDKGTLVLPLEGNGYLYSVLMRIADRAEAVQERDHEAGRKHGTATVTVKGEAMPIGAALERVYGDRDPELAKRDAHAKVATGMPEALRARLAELHKGAPATTPKDLSTEGEN
jgi:hypothetical protein